VGLVKQTMTVGHAYVSDLTSGEERTRALGLVSTASGVGFILGPIMGSLLCRISLRVPFVVSALIFVVNFVVLHFMMPHNTQQENKDVDEQSALSSGDSSEALTSPRSPSLLPASSSGPELRQRKVAPINSSNSIHDSTGSGIENGNGANGSSHGGGEDGGSSVVYVGPIADASFLDFLCKQTTNTCRDLVSLGVELRGLPVLLTSLASQVKAAPLLPPLDNVPTHTPHALSHSSSPTPRFS